MNQTPEQRARDLIDRALEQCGWIVQDKKNINLNAGSGIAVRECQTDAGPADYILFVEKKPVGVIEAKRTDEGVHLTAHEPQTQKYATAKLKHLDNQPLVFCYESTGEVTRFTDYRDPKPRSREVFSFHKPETFVKLLQRNRWDGNILELKSFIKTYHMPPDEIVIQQKDRIELVKINLMIEEGREFSFWDSISKIERTIVRYALKKHSENQAKAAHSLGISDRGIRHILTAPK